jgi:hypothetical protein
MQAQDLYIRLTDPAGKQKPIVSHHRVWDRELFISSTRKDFANKKNEDERRQVSLASESEYRKFMGYKEPQA